MKKKKLKAYALKKKLVIPKGTILTEWNGAYEAVIGLDEDHVVYLRTFDAADAIKFFEEV